MLNLLGELYVRVNGIQMVMELLHVILLKARMAVVHVFVQASFLRYKMAFILLQPQKPFRHRASWETFSLEFLGLFFSVTRAGVFIWENFHPGCRDLVFTSWYDVSHAMGK